MSQAALRGLLPRASIGGVPRPLLLFAPGAGASSHSPFMDRWAVHLSSIGEVTRFDYPYVVAGRSRPDRLPVLTAAHRAALAAVQGRREGPVILVGKSMGARVGCHLALEEPVAGLVCLGYPLRGRGGEIRCEVLLALRTPILFVQGTRDPLCPLELLLDVQRRMVAPSALHRVEGGDHGLAVRRGDLRGRGETPGDVEREALGAIARFAGRLAGMPAPGRSP